MDHTIFAVLQDKSFIWLEEEERRVAAHLHDVRAQMKARSPVMRLPPELLLRVFLYVQRGHAPIYQGYSSDWVVVTRICRYWREVALDSESLWSRIIPFSVQHMMTFLERAGHTITRKGAPLFLIWHGRIGGPAPLSVLRSFTDSFVNVDFTLRPEDIPSFEQLLEYTWNDLQELTLAVPMGVERECRPLDLGTLNRSFPPKLHSLSLHGVVPTTWSCGPMYCNLQSLSIERQSPFHKDLPTWEQLFNILESCPSLRRLMFRDADPPSSSSRTFMRKPILLSNLTYLELSFENPFDVAYMLSHLHIPAVAQMHIETEEEVDPESGVLACLPQALSDFKLLQPASHIEVTMATWGFLEANRRGGQEADVLFLSVKSWNLSLLFRSTCLQLRNICQFSAIETLRFCIKPYHLVPVTLTDWHQVFSCFASLRGLTYADGDLPDEYGSTPDTVCAPFRVVLQALTWPSESSLNTPNSRLLPHLNLLQFQDFRHDLSENLKPDIAQLEYSRRDVSFSCVVL